MKRLWRFLKWIVSGITYYHLYMFTLIGCLGFGSLMALAGYPLVRDVLFWTALVLVICMGVFLIAGYIGNLWDEFVDQEERAWNILKDEHKK